MHRLWLWVRTIKRFAEQRNPTSFDKAISSVTVGGALRHGTAGPETPHSKIFFDILRIIGEKIDKILIE